MLAARPTGSLARSAAARLCASRPRVARDLSPRCLGLGVLGERHPLAALPSSHLQRLQSTYAPSQPRKHFDPAPALDEAGRIPSAPYDLSPLPGSAPYYTAHLVVHPRTRPRPQTSWPSHLQAVSPLLSELESRTRKGGSLEGWGIAFSEGDAGNATSAEVAQAELRDWDPKTPKFMRPTPGSAEEEETFDLWAYSMPGKAAHVGAVSLRTLDADQPLRARLDAALQNTRPQTARVAPGGETHVYICTHGARDCRCGVVGEELLRALREEVRKHEERCLGEGKPQPKKVKVWSVSHVGGHKWAANALVYPHGDWYGNLRPTDAPLLLRSALAPATSMHDLNDVRERAVHWPRWRGRLGLEDLAQREHYDHWGPPLISSAQLVPRRRGDPASASPSESTTAPSTAAASSQSASTSTTTASSAAEPAPTNTTATATDEVSLRFRSYEGEWFNVPARFGESIKDVAKRADLPSIEATCGGECECATCHAYIAAPSSSTSSDAPAVFETPPPDEILPPASETEEDMLDYAISRKPTSRLTCQVQVTPELVRWMETTGGRIELPRF